MRHNRISVSTFFFINGFLYGNWTARIPEIQKYFDISNSMLGTLLFTMALGALIAMPFSGGLISRFGSDNVTRITGFIFCIIAPLLVISPNFAVASVFFFALGLSTGAMDVAMNGQAVFVERKYNKPIMSSFHAVFSIGMALGAGAGALFSRWEWSLFNHFLLGASVGLVSIVIASFYLLKDEKKEKSEDGESHFKLPTKAVIPLGIVAFCAMTGEGSMADWSALFMNKVVGETAALSALAMGAFSVAMTIGRIFGDRFTIRFGKKRLLIYNSVISILGLSIALIFASIWSTLLGFFMVGIGLSTMVPIVYSTAGNLKGVEPGAGIAMATTIGYSGFFVGPPTIGFLADNFGLRLALCFTLFLFIIMIIVVSKLRTD